MGSLPYHQTQPSTVEERHRPPLYRPFTLLLQGAGWRDDQRPPRTPCGNPLFTMLYGVMVHHRPGIHRLQDRGTGDATLTLRRQSLYTCNAYADGLMCHAFNLERRADSVLFHDEDHRAIPVPASFQRQ